MAGVRDAFLRGMRDLGYKSPAWALAEQIDNAFQAGADTVAIRFGFLPSNKTGAKPDHIAVIDNGNGMIPEMMGFAVRWGGTDRIMVAGSGAVLLQKALTDRGVPGRGVVVADTGVYVEACQSFLEGVRSGVVSHPRADSRRDMLDIAVRSAVQKRKGSAWGWGSSFKDGSEVPLEAVSLAYLGAKMAKARRGERSGRKRVSVV